MRLIDADELKKSLIDFPYGLRGWVLNIIDDQPTRDIVTCEDCKHYEMASNEANGWCEVNECPFAPWDFCSLGERKEE